MDDNPFRTERPVVQEKALAPCKFGVRRLFNLRSASRSEAVYRDSCRPPLSKIIARNSTSLNFCSIGRSCSDFCPNYPGKQSSIHKSTPPPNLYPRFPPGLRALTLNSQESRTIARRYP